MHNKKEGWTDASEKKQTKEMIKYIKCSLKQR